jgi:hypothetical protein
MKLTFAWVKNHYKTIIGTVAGAVIIYLLINLANGNAAEFKQLKKDNKVLQVQIDSVRKDNNFLISRIYEVEKSQILVNQKIDENNLQIERNNTNLIKLQKAYHAQISNVNYYSITDLDSFFRARYAGYYPQTP